MYHHFHKRSVGKKPRNAFTLIELLAVVAVVVILTGIAFGVRKGVLNQQARAQVKAELAIIAQALEEFKLAYGDYPWIARDSGAGAEGVRGLEYSNARALSRALTGLAVFERASTGNQIILKDLVESDRRKSFLDEERMTIVEEASGEKLLVDPWRRPYIYIYNKNHSSWDNIGYVLFSKGPDGTFDLGSVVTTGMLDQANDENNDNIYPNE